MIVLAFSLAYAGFLALCLSMSRHYRDVFHRSLPDRTARMLRGGGWILLAASLAASVAHSGGPVGTVLWIALLTAGAALVVLLLTYAPRRVLALAAGMLPLSLIAAMSGF